MKTLVGRFASPEDAGEAIFALRMLRPPTARLQSGGLGRRVMLMTTLCVAGGAALGYLSATGALGSLSPVSGASGISPIGGAVLGFAIGIPAGLILGLLFTIFPVRDSTSFRVQRVSHHYHTLVIQTTNRLAAQLTDALREAHALKVHTFTGKVESDQVGSALDQMRSERPHTQ
jgi:hypothetical protein